MKCFILLRASVHSAMQSPHSNWVSRFLGVKDVPIEMGIDRTTEINRTDRHGCVSGIDIDRCRP